MSARLRIFSAAGAGALVLLLAGFAGSAVAKDRNHDRIPDRWEKRFHLSLRVDQSDRDQDRDGVDNLNEFQEGTNPRDRDTDNDGRPDGREDADHDGLNNHMEDVTANLPDDRDTDNNGIEDGDENAGVIESFDGTTLVINLAGGGQVSGTVDSTTEIECETEDEHEVGDNSGPGSAVASHDDNSGPGSTSSGPGGDNEIEHGDEDNVCTTSDLTPNTVVHEAELRGGTFEEIELVK
jgi:hypothetical protein